MPTKFVFLMLLAVAASACTKPDYKTIATNPEILHNGVYHLTEVIMYDIFSPPVASRIYAYSTIAAHEAMAAGGSTSLSGKLNGLQPLPKPTADICAEVAAFKALMKVGTTLIFSEDKMKSYQDSVLNIIKNTNITAEMYQNSVTYGDTIAKCILAWAAKDNYKQTRTMPKFELTDQIGAWKPTPPAYMEALEPNWSKIRTFMIDSAAQFVLPRPAMLQNAADTVGKNAFFDEAKEVITITKNLTPEQKSIANFWDCNPLKVNVVGHVMIDTKKITPGGHWINIVGIAARKAKFDAQKSARAYALTAVALVDGFITCWDEKYRSGRIRPETAINKYLNNAWQPLLQTPPFPEYPSGHSTISAAAAAVLTHIFGANFSFTDDTEIAFGMPPRSFASFDVAAQQASISRLYGGIHYRSGCEQGAALGTKVGTHLLQKIK
jgi:hypothetical protein